MTMSLGWAVLLESVGLHREGEVELSDVLAFLSKHPAYHEAGAIASFVGVVREDPVQESKAKVTHLEYEAYSEVALKRLQDIRERIKKKNGVIEVSIHHVIDRLNVGEPSLFVAVLGRHRQHVFPALSETVELVKREVPIWKKEFTGEDSYWVSAKEAHEH
jgi:molybdopterin synthase catalytic subunit